jgi:hypothetical protein
VRRIAAKLRRTADGSLAVSYVLEADLSRLRIPAPAAPRIGENLWQHTCFELFIARQMPAYHEFNFSPSGAWAAYAFERYRERRSLTDETLRPSINARSSAQQLEIDALISLDRLLPGNFAGKAKLGLSAVIEDADGGLSYWALRHPPGKPDFHHPEAFAVELDEVRN